MIRYLIQSIIPLKKYVHYDKLNDRDKCKVLEKLKETYGNSINFNVNDRLYMDFDKYTVVFHNLQQLVTFISGLNRLFIVVPAEYGYHICFIHGNTPTTNHAKDNVDLLDLTI